MIPKNAKRIPLRPLALGEISGHHHSLYSMDGNVAVEDAAEMYEVQGEDGTTTYLRVTGDCVALCHQEHKTQALPAGDYRVVLQREETEWGAAPVRD